MSQTRKKRRESGTAEKRAQVQAGLQIAEVLEALAGLELADKREREAAAKELAEQEELIASTQEAERRAASGFQLKRTVESLLFAADRPLQLSGIRQLLGSSIDRKELQDCLDTLVEEYSTRGIVLHDVAGGYQFRTHPASSTWIQKLIAGRPVRLSRAQLDTLAIIAYRQPITRPEIDDIRGVDSGSTLKVLLDRNLLRILGKKEEAGRPLLYGTSKDFLEFFNLSELRDLPTLREFHELNDDGMAQVDKLGADIKGVDVGAVAAEAAAERAEAKRAAEELESALADEKRQAKEAVKEAAKAARMDANGVAEHSVDAVEDTIELPSLGEATLSSMDEETMEQAPHFAGDGSDDEEARAEYDETSKEPEMSGREHDTESDAEVGDEELSQGDDNTRIDLTPAPSRDPDTILEDGDDDEADSDADVDATRTDIAAASPDNTVVDRMAAPETKTDIQSVSEHTVLDSTSIEHTIPEGTLADILPPGLSGANGQPGVDHTLDDLTIVPTDSSD